MIRNLRRRFVALILDNKGITAMEYGVLAAAVLAAVALAANTLGVQIGTQFSNFETIL